MQINKFPTDLHDYSYHIYESAKNLDISIYNYVGHPFFDNF